MNQGGWALVISGLSLGVSLALGIWQVWRYYLEGGRLTVTLEIGALHPDALTRRPVDDRTRASAAKSTNFEEYYIEVLVVSVANRGRTAATLTNVGLDIGSSSESPKRRGRDARSNRLRLTPTAFAFNGSSVTTPKRLEPLDSCLYIFDAEPALRAELASDATTCSLRGSVTVAGLGAPRLSKEVLNTRSGRRHLSIEPPSIGRLIFAELDRERRRRDAEDEGPMHFSPFGTALEIQAAVESGVHLYDAVHTHLTIDGGTNFLCTQVMMNLREHGRDPWAGR